MIFIIFYVIFFFFEIYLFLASLDVSRVACYSDVVFSLLIDDQDFLIYIFIWLN